MGYCNHGYDRKKLIGLSSVFSQNLGNSEESPFFEYHTVTEDGHRAVNEKEAGPWCRSAS